VNRFRQRIQWAPTLWLTVVWVLLWGDLSLGTVLAGVLVAVLILAVFPLPPLAVGVTIRPVALAILVLRFLGDMVVASVHVAWLTVRPGPPVRGLVVDLHLRSHNELFQTITSEMVALVPGTLVIDMVSDTGVLTLHVLNISTRAEAERIRRRVLAQEARVVRALDPDPDAVLDPRRRRRAELGGAS
jgi:multicomponent Na+:H+ antiporter subunit E